jgi:hypothetical protein
MLDSASEKEIALFFDGFVEAFSTFDGTAVGRLFVAPGVALKRDGALSRIWLPLLPLFEPRNALLERQDCDSDGELGSLASKRLGDQSLASSLFLVAVRQGMADLRLSVRLRMRSTQTRGRMTGLNAGKPPSRTAMNDGRDGCGPFVFFERRRIEGRLSGRVDFA